MARATGAHPKGSAELQITSGRRLVLSQGHWYEHKTPAPQWTSCAQDLGRCANDFGSTFLFHLLDLYSRSKWRRKRTHLRMIGIVYSDSSTCLQINPGTFL